MTRKDILNYIKYEGEYTKEVKKKLRELLKKYHPDHYKKESDTFKKINEIKKELDSGKKLSFDEPKENDKPSVADYKITEEIIDLSKKRDELLDKKKKYQEELSRLQDEYRIEYETDVNYRNEAVDSANEVIKVQERKQKYNILLVISIFISIIFIFTKIYYALIITVILFGFALYNYIKIEILLDKKLKVNCKTIKVSENNIKKIRSINETINGLYKKIWDVDCDINRLNTRINLLKAKIR